MATKYVCDACGAEVSKRSDLWLVELRPLESVTAKAHYADDTFFDNRKYTKAELCPKCKTKVYLAMVGANGEGNGNEQ